MMTLSLKSMKASSLDLKSSYMVIVTRQYLLTKITYVKKSRITKSNKSKRNSK